MSKKNIYRIVGLLLFISLACYGTYLRVNSPIGIMGDTGLLYGLVQGVHDGYGPNLPLYASIADTLFTFNLPSLSPDLVCKTAQLPLTYSLEKQNFFQYHSYLIIYPLSIFLYAFSAPYVIQGANLFSFLIFIALSFIILRKKNINLGFVFLGCTLICFSPPWSFAIIGQPYVDRMFLPFGLLIFHYSDKKNLIGIIICGLIACLINEKVPIYLGIFFVISSIIFYENKYKKFYVLQFIIGLFIIVFVYGYIKYYLNNSYYSVAIPTSYDAIKNFLSTERNLNGILSLLIICSPFIIFPLIFSWRYAIISLIMLSPNIFGDIGGAEKTNFYTHYHSLYFPFIVYSFLVGFSKFLSSQSKICINARKISIIFLSLMIVFYNGLIILPNQSLSFNIGNKNSFLFGFNSIRRTQISWKNIQSFLEKNVPITSSVSSIEAGMAYLYKYRDLSFYPLNLTNSEYIFVIKGDNKYNGYFGYNGASIQDQTNKCLSKVIDSKFDTPNMINVTPDYVLIKRRNNL